MKTRSKITIISLVSVAAIGLWAGIGLYTNQNKIHQLSIKPERSYSAVTLEPQKSQIGLQAKLSHRTLVAAAEQATADSQTGKGEKQTCKKVLGAKVCATLQWEYQINRDGAVEVRAKGERLELIMPISFSGRVGVDGNGGKLLGLRNKDIDGKLQLIADVSISVKPNWCPALDSNVSYKWLSDPQIRLIGNIRVNLRKSVDKALKRKLTDIENKLASAIDCQELRRTIQKQWHVHSLPVKLQDDVTSTLHVTPVSAAASDIAIKPDHVAFAFELGALVELLPNDASATSHKDTLPDLQAYTRNKGQVEFSLLTEIPYQQLSNTLTQKLSGKTYGSSQSLTINKVDLYPTDELLTIDVSFNARASKLLNTQGNVYISARPVADPTNNTLHLTDLALTRTIDSRLLTALTAVLRNQLITALEKASTIDLAPSMQKVEQSIADTLANPENTAGIHLTAEAPTVRLVTMNPQANGLAAVLHLSTNLRASIDEGILNR